MIVPLRIHEPNERLVKFLERMLEEAKAGEAQGIIGAVIFDSGATDDFWIDPPKVYHTTVVSDRVIGAMSRCSHSLMMARWAEEQEQVKHI